MLISLFFKHFYLIIEDSILILTNGDILLQSGCQACIVKIYTCTNALKIKKKCFKGALKVLFKVL